MNDKNENKGAKEKSWTEKRLKALWEYTHTHTSLLANKKENKLNIEKAHRLSILY